MSRIPILLCVLFATLTLVICTGKITVAEDTDSKHVDEGDHITDIDGANALLDALDNLDNELHKKGQTNVGAKMALLADEERSLKQQLRSLLRMQVHRHRQGFKEEEVGDTDERDDSKDTLGEKSVKSDDASEDDRVLKNGKTITAIKQVNMDDTAEMDGETVMFNDVYDYNDIANEYAMPPHYEIANINDETSDILLKLIELSDSDGDPDLIGELFTRLGR